jgi:SUKH-3 immunity protein
MAASRPGGPRFIPVRPAVEVAGFRFATPLDGVDENGRAKVAPERGYVTDPAERERLLAYLAGGATVLSGYRYGPDGFDPNRPRAVRVGYRTDGVWVWPFAVEYYLREYGVCPEPALRGHIAGLGYQAPTVPDDVVRAAADAVSRRQRDFDQRRLAYLAEHGLMPTSDSRFPPEVDTALRELGWYPGRDVRDRVDAWLEVARPDFADAAFERDGYPPYEPIPAARRVLDEFGGLRSLSAGRGIAGARTPFDIFPRTGDDDLSWMMFHVQALGRRLGQRAFQIGQVEQGMGALAVDEQGRVFLTGTIDLFVAGTFDEALRYLLLGARFPTPPGVPVP